MTDAPAIPGIELRARPRVVPFGDLALLAILGDGVDPELNRRVHGLAARIRAARRTQPAWGSPVPGYATVLAPFDPERLDPAARAGRPVHAGSAQALAGRPARGPRDARRRGPRALRRRRRPRPARGGRAPGPDARTGRRGARRPDLPRLPAGVRARLRLHGAAPRGARPAAPPGAAAHGCRPGASRSRAARRPSIPSRRPVAGTSSGGRRRTCGTCGSSRRRSCGRASASASCPSEGDRDARGPGSRPAHHDPGWRPARCVRAGCAAVRRRRSAGARGRQHPAGQPAGCGGARDDPAGSRAGGARQPCVVALAGADFQAKVPEDGRRLRPGTTHLLRAGHARVSFGAARDGARGYLALAGGVDVPEVLGSRSTAPVGGFGGLDGRPLAEGDRIRPARPRGAGPGRSFLAGTRAALGGRHARRVRAPCTWSSGPHAAEFPPEAMELLLATAWTVTPAQRHDGRPSRRAAAAAGRRVRSPRRWA